MMGVFDKLSMTDEEKEQARQLNEIGYVNALNTHNWELQQKVQMFDGEITRLRERLAEADEANRRVSDMNEKLRELVKAAYYEAYRDRDRLGDGGTDDPEDRCAWRLSAAAAAIRESGE